MTSRWTLLASGFGFVEGPVWDGERLLFSDLADDVRRAWTPGGEVIVVATDTGRGNGQALTRSGRLLVCEHLSSSLVECVVDGSERRVLASAWQGLELNSPNDVIVADDGTIFFTDPGYGRRSDRLGSVRSQQLAFQGVYRLRPSGALVLLTRGLEQPNGLVLTSSGELVVADTARDVLAICADPFGRGEDWREFCGVPGGGPDGMDIDGNRFLVASRRGIEILSADGVPVDAIPLPERATNVCRTPAGALYVTAGGSLYEIHPD